MLIRSYALDTSAAISSIRSPSGVGLTPDLLLSSRRTPANFSSSEIFLLTAGWDMPSCRAAAVKLPVDSTV